jgi:hypothetical protein
MRPVRSLTIGLVFAIGMPCAFTQVGIGPIRNSVPSANARVGIPATVIARGFKFRTLAVGVDSLENPSAKITHYGLLADGTRTEPDQNLYLVLQHVSGPTPGYNYGHHFLLQGHENGGDLAYVTRINLDVKDPAHRITLLTPEGADGFTHFNSVDGSTYDPFTNTFLFTQEAGTSGGVFQITNTWPPVVNTLDGILGKGGYEGIHPDDRGNLLIIEDAGGVSVNVNPADPTSPKTAKQPNSFVYRFLPYDRRNISAGGELQALQVSIDGQTVVFNAGDPVGDTFSVKQVQLHTPGTSYPVKWVTIHDTAVDGTTRSMRTLLRRLRARRPSSGLRTRHSCRDRASTRSSSVQPETPTRLPEIRRISQRADPGDQSSASTCARIAIAAGFLSLCSATQPMPRSTTSPSPIQTP